MFNPSLSLNYIFNPIFVFHCNNYVRSPIFHSFHSFCRFAFHLFLLTWLSRTETWTLISLLIYCLLVKYIVDFQQYAYIFWGQGTILTKVVYLSDTLYILCVGNLKQCAKGPDWHPRIQNYKVTLLKTVTTHLNNNISAN